MYTDIRPFLIYGHLKVFNTRKIAATCWWHRITFPIIHDSFSNVLLCPIKKKQKKIKTKTKNICSDLVVSTTV